jgi:hypothetical protein
LRGGHKIRVALKFCGSCNPEIDLSNLAGSLIKYLSGREDIELLPAGSACIDLQIVLCGCLRACADSDEFKQQARHNIIVAGESLAGARYDETQIYNALIAEIERLSAEAGD